MYTLRDKLPASVEADDDEARKRELAKQEEKKQRLAEDLEDRENLKEVDPYLQTR